MHSSNIQSLNPSQPIHRLISQALELDLSKLKLGSTPIDGDLFIAVKVQDKDRTKKDSLIEVHKNYIDVHIVLSGQESLTYAIQPVSSTFMKNKEFDNDVEFMECVAGEQNITLKAGEFVVFYPGEWHRPMVSETGGLPIDKVVLKIDASLLAAD